MGILISLQLVVAMGFSAEALVLVELCMSFSSRLVSSGHRRERIHLLTTGRPYIKWASSCDRPHV